MLWQGLEMLEAYRDLIIDKRFLQGFLALHLRIHGRDNGCKYLPSPIIQLLPEIPIRTKD